MSDSSTVSELEEPPSSDSRQEGNNRIQDGDPSGVPLSGPSSGGPAELATAAAASRPAAAVHNTEGAPTARGEATAPDPAVNLLGILHQMQEQQLQAQLQQQQYQQHQQQMLAELMQQLHPGRSPGRTQAGARRHGALPCPPLYRAGTATPAVRWSQRGGT